MTTTERNRGAHRVVGRILRALAAAGLVGATLAALESRESPLPASSGLSSRSGVLEGAVGYQPDGMDTLIAQHDRRIAQCMARRGFRWSPPAPDPQYRLSPHGLFGVDTPAAVNDFLNASGYGVVEQVSVIRAEYRAFRAAGSDTSVEMSRAEAARYRASLSGSDGCEAQADRAVGVDPRTGGSLGASYSKAMDAFHASGAYRDFEHAVLTCMNHRGVNIDSLDQAAAPLLVQLVKIVGGRYHRSPDGSLTYEIGSNGPRRFRTADLMALRKAEMRQAQVELHCRRTNEAPILRLWADYSAPLLHRYAPEITRLHHAIENATEKEERS